MRRRALLRRREGQRHTIDAVAESGGRRAVGKDVPEVSAALAAVHLRARHAVAAIDRLTERAFEG